MIETTSEDRSATQEEIDEVVCRALHDNIPLLFRGIAEAIQLFEHSPDQVSSELAFRGLQMPCLNNITGETFDGIAAAARHMYRVKEGKAGK